MYKKNSIAALLAATMLLPTNAFALSASDFSDFPTDWSAAAVSHAVEHGLLTGSDGKINAAGKLTRAEMAAVVNRAFGAKAAASITGYSDMAEGAWYYDDMAKAVQMGTFVGADGKLTPNNHITREEAFAVLARAFALEDGSAAALNRYTDGDQVSGWAAGSFAAMVESGYVQGANGKLSPKDTITRAEFAQVMYTMAGSYVSAAGEVSQNVSGNLIIRAAGATLKNMTVDGDLILADGVDAGTVVLDEVSVQGRVVIRSGSIAVLSGSLSGVQVMNSAKGCQIQVEKGAAIETVRADAADMKVSGQGTVGSVQAGANNVSVSTSGTKVTAANGTSGVLAGSKPVAAGSTETVGEANTGASGSSSGSSSSGGSGGSSGDSSSGGSTTAQQLVIAEQTKLVDLGYAQYVSIAFAEGYNAENCTVTIDGTDVTGVLTPVTDDGSIMKWEITSLNPAKLTATSGGKTQTVTLSSNANPTAPVAVENTDADYFLTHGAVYVWDYHLTNYDANGNERVSPSKTTFALDSKDNTIKFYAPDAVLTQDETAAHPYHVSGEVEIMFNYASGTDTEKAWVDGITNVALVAYDERSNTLNDSLTYTLDKAHPHGSTTVACITVPLGQSNFYTNGRYQLRITSDGESRLFPIHVVNAVVPSMKLIDSSVESGKNVHFKVENMLYGVTMPVYRVELTNPAGETAELAKYDDWYLIGDTFVLYNDNTNHIAENGNYTLTVYADGFQKFGKTFSVGAAAAQQASCSVMSVDAISKATGSSGGASSGTGAEGGSNTMDANLVFNGDLLANALLLGKIGVEHDYAKAIADRWNYDLIPDAIYMEGAARVYTTAGYFDAVNEAKRNGEYLSFAEYIRREDAETTANRPYAVKQVLEDNLLGKMTGFGESANKPASDLTLVNSDGETIVAVPEGSNPIFRADADYLSRITAIYPQGNAYNRVKYTVEGDTLTLTDLSGFKFGANTFTIEAEGYQTARITFPYQKVLEEVTLSAEDGVLGQTVTITCINHADSADCDFLKSLSRVTLNGPDDSNRNVLPEGQESAGWGYTIRGNILTLGAKLFEEWGKEAGEYSVTLTAQYGYEPQTVRFTMEAKLSEEPDTETKDAPVVAGVKKVTGFDNYYRVSFTEENDALQSYLGSDLKVVVDGSEYTKASHFLSDSQFKVSSGGYGPAYLDLALNGFRTEGSTTVKVTSAGYADLTFTVDQDGKLVTGSGASGGSSESGGTVADRNSDVVSGAKNQ